MAAINTHLVDMLCENLPFTRSEAWLLICSASRRYKVHSIEKRNGRGKRLIAQPTAEVKAVQRWILKAFIEKMPIHNAATAYRRSVSIKDHTVVHARNKYLLKIDFKDFFPSVLAKDFETHICKHLAVTPEMAIDLAKLLFRYDEQKQLSLAIGAPSSPALSNTLLYEFDTRLDEYCKSRDANYSRYADDLAISTNVPHVLDDIYKYIEKIIRELDYPKLTINPDKTVFTSKKFQRQLTGLILTNEGKVSLGREKKREIRAMANNYANGKLDPFQNGRLKGLLAFAHSVEPAFVLKIRIAMGEDRYSVLLNYVKS